MSSYDYPQGRESSHTHRPLADPANKLSYVVVSSSGVQKKLVNPTKGEEPIDLGLEKQEIIDSINERAAEHAHHHHHYHDEFGPGSTAYHDGEHHHGHDHDALKTARSPQLDDGLVSECDHNQDVKGGSLEPTSAASHAENPPVPANAAPTVATEHERADGKKADKTRLPKGKKAKKGDKASKRALSEALEAAAVDMNAKKFAKMWDKRHDATGINQAGCFETSGCYAILSYPKNAKKPWGYIGAYVGGSHNMGASVMRHLQGEGNPDVYADVKYGQRVRVLLYPYPEELLRSKSHELIELLDKKRLYNTLD